MLARQGRRPTDGAEHRDRRGPVATGTHHRDGRCPLRRPLPPFGGLHDIRPLVRRAQIGSALDPEELAETVETLKAVDNLQDWLDRVGDQFPRLGGLKAGVGRFTGLANAIESCIDVRGKILDTASRKLSTIRREVAQVEERIQETLRRMLRSNEIKRILRYPEFHDGRTSLRPADRQGASGRDPGVGPSDQRQQRDRLHRAPGDRRAVGPAFLPAAKELKEIRRILRWLSAQVGQVADSLLGSLETLAELDLVYARGRYSIDYRMSPPDFNTEGKLSLRGARHPLLEALFRSEAMPRPKSARTEPSRRPPREPRQVTPIDIHLGLQFQILVITGPNTGGKTVAIKTVGLLAVMAQSGLHIPAHQGSQLPIFDDVLSDIGDEQSLEQSLSTFSSHIRRISKIVATATEHSLVMLDEMGAGTDPAEGGARPGHPR